MGLAYSVSIASPHSWNQKVTSISQEAADNAGADEFEGRGGGLFGCRPSWEEALCGAFDSLVQHTLGGQSDVAIELLDQAIVLGKGP